MSYTIAEIAKATGLSAVGNTACKVTGIAPPQQAGADDLILAMSEKYAEELRHSPARMAVLWDGADWQAMGLDAALFAPRPRYALAGITALFQHPPAIEPGIHPSTHIHPSARIGDGAAIGAFTSIGAGACIGENARIDSHVSIGAGAHIGPGALIHAGARIGARCRIGANFIAQPNAVIGGDGFSFVTPERGAVESAKSTGTVAKDAHNTSLRRIHSLAAVVLGDDVEVGAGTTIDRGTLSDTMIGNATKLDNLVQIGHNVRIGATCLICAQVGIAGSATIGDRVVLGGKVGIGDHLCIGSDSVIAAGSLVGNNVPPQSVMLGTPAIERDKMLQQFRALRRLPRMAAQLREVREKLGL